MSSLKNRIKERSKYVVIVRSNDSQEIAQIKEFYKSQKRNLGYATATEVLEQVAYSKLQNGEFRFNNKQRLVINSKKKVYKYGIIINKEFGNKLREQFGNGAVQMFIYKYYLKYKNN
jgi:hypothetical protein